MTRLALDLIELGHYFDQHFILDDPISCFCEFGLGFRQPVDNLAGGKVCPLDVLDHFIAKMAALPNLRDWGTWVVNQAKEAVVLMRSEDIFALADRVDWLCKLKMLAEMSFEVGSDQAREVELAYHDIANSEIIYQEGILTRYFLDADIQSAVIFPPPGRAKNRADAIARLGQLRRQHGDLTVGWSGLYNKMGKCIQPFGLD